MGVLLAVPAGLQLAAAAEPAAALGSRRQLLDKLTLAVAAAAVPRRMERAARVDLAL